MKSDGRPTGEQAGAAGGLIVVATPIGHPGDIGQRARECLRDADLIAAEDTRVARTLLSRLQIAVRGRLRSLFEANERAKVAPLLEALRSGQTIALISDAGTPLVSDPGFVLVCAVIEAGLPLCALPGPNAALTALVLSGLPPDRFLFCGFLPRKAGKRRAALAQLRTQSATLLFYEAPHRVAATLEDLASTLGPRRAALARQLTKPEEEVRRGSLCHLAAEVAGQRLHGEITLVVEGAQAAAEPDWTDAERLMDVLARNGLSPRQIRDITHEVHGGDKKALYRRALALAGGERG